MSIKSFSITLIIILSSFLAFSQATEEVLVPKSINDQFDKILNDHKDWEIYKVVPVTKMNAFKKALNDTISKKEAKIKNLVTQIEDGTTQIEDERKKVETLKAELALSDEKNDEIVFLGISFAKTPYQVMVWSIIVVLIILMVFFYLMYLRSNSISTHSRKEIEQVKNELEELRTKAHEKQIKLKRQLQTAENLLSEKGLKR